MKNMKCKMKKVLKEWQWTLLALFTICIYSCKDDENVETETFDPSKPVVISDFTPKEGGAYQKLLIYGENFGTDASNVKVKIGGKEAIVINVKSTYVYCFVPSGAFSGEIEITVGEGENSELGLDAELTGAAQFYIDHHYDFSGQMQCGLFLR